VRIEVVGGEVGGEWQVSMKILTYNARGLGGGEKRVEVRRLVSEKRPMVLCIQETKLELVNDQVIKALWGEGMYNFSYQPSVGASGGMVTVWDTSRVEVWTSSRFNHVLAIKGKVILTGEVFIIFNVYAPCDLAAKKMLWECLTVHVMNNSDLCIYVCGDFNSVRSVEERKGRAVAFRQAEVDAFNKFIHDSFLIDLPICGRSFTWFRGDGISMSRLDQFLLSNKWCQQWPNSIQVAHQRGLSDHVPVMLHVDASNWGPRPLRMLKCWSELPGYAEFFRERWSTFRCQGWGGFVLQQKLKWIKAGLREWHTQHVQNMEGRMIEIKDKMSDLDVKAESAELHADEVSELRGLSLTLHSLARLQNSMNWQKSRLNWLKEGDANSKIFHGYMSQRRRQNAINVVFVDGGTVEGVHNIRAAVFHHFSTHFKKAGVDRPTVDG